MTSISQGISRKALNSVLITSPLAKGEQIQRRLREAGCRVRLGDLGPASTEDHVVAELRGVEAVVATAERYTRRTLASADKLRVIARTGTGYDSIDVAAATEFGIAVCTAPGSNDGTVADFAVLLMLALARRLGLPLRREVASPIFGTDFFGKTVGVIGTGRIGRQVVRRVSAFDCPVLLYDLAPDPGFTASSGAGYVNLETLLREADFITVHVPLSSATRDFISDRELRMMKRTSFLVNTARGAVIDQDALYRALVERRIAGAGLDVFKNEPLEADSPLRLLDNVILTPHVAGVTTESAQRAAEIAVENVLRVLANLRPLSCVNSEVLDR